MEEGVAWSFDESPSHQTAILGSPESLVGARSAGVRAALERCRTEIVGSVPSPLTVVLGMVLLRTT